MSVVAFDYWDLAGSYKAAKKTVSYLNEYVKDMHSVETGCYQVRGSDTAGYVNCAADLVRQKIVRANEIKTAYADFANKLEELETFAEETDRSVANYIDITVSGYLGKRSWGQTAVDWLYNGYLFFMNGVESLPLIGKPLAYFSRQVDNWLVGVGNQIHNYFKYGNGKYIWNGVKAVAGAVVAVAGAVIAVAGVIAGTAATPLLAGVALIGAVASCIYAVLKAVDSETSVKQNIKAFKLGSQHQKSTKDKQGDWWDTENDQGSITAARYYGSISGVKDWIDKTDLGDKSANDTWAVIGTSYKAVEDVAGLVSGVCQLWVGIGNAQYVKGADGNWVKYQNGKTVPKTGSFVENVWTSYAEDLGVSYQRTNKFQKYSRRDGNLRIDWKKTDFKKAFELKFFQGYTKKVQKLNLYVSKEVLAIVNGAKLFMNTDGLISNLETFAEWDRSEDHSWSDLKDTGEAFHDTIGNVSGVDTLQGDAIKTYGIVSDLIEDIKDLFTPEKMNAYELFCQQDKISGLGVQAAGEIYAGVGGGGRF